MPRGLTEVEVERVVDGDTLRLRDGRSVRLIGLNAPEKARRGQAAEPLALEATRALQRRVAASGDRVRLLPGRQPQDRYGRLLAHAFDRHGQSLEAAQLAAGLALTVAIAPNTERLSCLLAAENEARRLRRGLWMRPPLRQTSQLQAGFALVQGRVQRIDTQRGGIWLELDGQLAVRIAPAQRARFDRRQLEALAGRRIEVRGWVIDRSRRGSVPAGRARWQLTLDDPALLRVL
ncbi:thermonuclease family protein [Pseudomonas sp. NW5]|uniref:thermonuclease family protein n=1 Tax=Pseudomonas sp. NW5 TaxID=2934934 RepID=UPI002022327D|nr:thermonuclease family protein [Pseudomonas sp. NW5]MCL7461799.1 thermonuclease family protein [Pseudomonas sp. NW5]